MNAFVQGTRRPWAIDITSTVTGVDLTTIASAVLYVHRLTVLGVATVETWTTTLGAATATTLTLTNTPTASGVGSVDTAEDTLTFRAILTPTSGANIECSRFVCKVVEK